MKRKPRLDELLVQRGFFADLHAAQAAVLAGDVVVGEHRQTSAGMRLDPSAALRVKSKGAFASRGGLKLDHALASFGIDVRDKRCIDLGASTGGFTDCLLKRGALHVTAVDVGEPLMRWELQHDERVDYRCKTNVKGLDPRAVSGPFDLAVADLSFISLTSVLEDISALLSDGASFVSLVKPQFEVAHAQVGQGGIVRDPALHEQALKRVLGASAACGLPAKGLVFSPVTGTKGNIEFLYWACKEPCDMEAGMLAERFLGAIMPAVDIGAVVAAAHAELGALQ